MPSAKVYGGGYDGLEITFDVGPLPAWIILDSPAPPLDLREDGKLVFPIHSTPPCEYHLEYVQEDEDGCLSPFVDPSKPVLTIYVPHPLVEIRDPE
jgi:hypothetical protein